jgi:hypothetical protein
MLLDRSVLGKEPLKVLKFSTAPSTFNKCKKKAELQRTGMEIAMFLLGNFASSLIG